MNLGTLTQFERSENYVPKIKESSLKGADEYWRSESSLNGPEMNSAGILILRSILVFLSIKIILLYWAKIC